MQHAERGSHKAAALALSHATVRSWARRAREWCKDVRTANLDDNIADTLADSNFREDTPPTPHHAPPGVGNDADEPERAFNAAINKTVAHLDTAMARDTARSVG